jgi:hypothetical protein
LVAGQARLTLAIDGSICKLMLDYSRKCVGSVRPKRARIGRAAVSQRAMRCRSAYAFIALGNCGWCRMDI